MSITVLVGVANILFWEYKYFQGHSDGFYRRTIELQVADINSFSQFQLILTTSFLLCLKEISEYFKRKQQRRCTVFVAVLHDEKFVEIDREGPEL